MSSTPNGPKTADQGRQAFKRIPKFCEWSDLSSPTVHRLVKKGLLKKVRIGGASLICMASAHKLFSSGYRQPVRGEGVDDAR
jgi:hypothetical protein